MRIELFDDYSLLEVFKDRVSAMMQEDKDRLFQEELDEYTEAEKQGEYKNLLTQK